jgi:hypothetical protein
MHSANTKDTIYPNRIIHLNQVELSRRWRLSPRTLERWRWEGVGPSFLKVGGRVLYRLGDIEAFEAEKLHSGGVTAVARARRPGAIAIFPKHCAVNPLAHGRA